MSPDEWLARASRTFGNGSVAEAVPKLRKIVGPRSVPASLGSVAQRALDALRSGLTPGAGDLQALEYAIRLTRPAILSQGGRLPPLPPDYQALPCLATWPQFIERVAPYLHSIGRVDLAEGHGIHLGTGFLVGEAGTLATNKHVLDRLSLGVGRLEPGQAVVRFGKEHATVPEQHAVPITGVLAIHPTQDVVLLTLGHDPSGRTRPALPLHTAASAVGDPVVTVGYPARETTGNPRFQHAVYGGDFGVKRASPGEIRGHLDVVLQHDCSTLAGNSGSPVMCMRTGQVVGLHRSGFSLSHNEALLAHVVKSLLHG